MAASKKTLADSILTALDEDTYEHFRYNKLFLNGVNSKDKDAVSLFLQNEYLGGKSPEEFAMTHIQDAISKDMSKFVVKKKGTDTHHEPDKSKGASSAQ